MIRKGISIKEYLNREINQTTIDILNYLLKHKYTEDYVPSYNVITFGYLFIQYNLIPDDLIYLCNRISKIFKNPDYENCDNYRFSINKISKEYEEILNKGCCGFFDKEFYNPLTKNTLYFGFNFGH